MVGEGAQCDVLRVHHLCTIPAKKGFTESNPTETIRKIQTEACNYQSGLFQNVNVMKGEEKGKGLLLM